MNVRSPLPWQAPRPVLQLGRYGGLKDPCVVRYQGLWHLFATGCKENWTYDVVHAVAPRPTGPWTMLPPADVVGAEGPSLCAPGVVADGEPLHMVVQESYNLLGGNIRHLAGLEGGQLTELPDGRVLLSAVCFLPDGDHGTRQRIFVAVADDAEGPYEVLGPGRLHVTSIPAAALSGTASLEGVA